MSRTRKHEEIGAPKLLPQVERVEGRHNHIVIARRDEHIIMDRLEKSIRKRVRIPCEQGLDVVRQTQTGGEAGEVGLPVLPGYLAAGADDARNPGLALFLGDEGREEGVDGGAWGGDRGEDGTEDFGHGAVTRDFATRAARGAGSGQDELAHKVWTGEGELLGDEAADGESQNVESGGGIGEGG